MGLHADCADLTVDATNRSLRKSISSDMSAVSELPPRCTRGPGPYAIPVSDGQRISTDRYNRCTVRVRSPSRATFVTRNSQGKTSACDTGATTVALRTSLQRLR